MEGAPDHGVEIVAIREGEGEVRFDVRRGVEEWTFEIVRPGVGGRGGRGAVAARGPARGGASVPARRSAPSSSPPDVKAVDFFGPDGRVIGARVTGVRPGSRLAGAGLLRGDVVSRADGAIVASARDLRDRLAGGEAIAALGVQRGGNAAPVEIVVGR
jgi:membrane-associated protease RseP (regulator of RpoE activity)